MNAPRTMTRFSLGALLGLFTLMAVGSAALASRAPAAMYCVVTLAVLLLGLAIPAALILRGAGRAFCGGIAVFGWGYMLLTFHPWFSNFGANLLSTRVLIFAWDNVEQPIIPARESGRPSFLDDDDVEGMTESYTMLMLRGFSGEEDRFGDYLRELRAFFFIGQALWAMVLGLLGGFVCALLHDWQARRTD